MAQFVHKYPRKKKQGKKHHRDIRTAGEKQKNSLYLTMQAALKKDKWHKHEQEPDETVEGGDIQGLELIG